VRLISRGGYDWTSRFPWIGEAALKNRVRQFVIDGEAVILGVDGISDFNVLHSGRHNEEVQLCAFDVLAMDGGRFAHDLIVQETGWRFPEGGRHQRDSSRQPVVLPRSYPNRSPLDFLLVWKSRRYPPAYGIADGRRLSPTPADCIGPSLSQRDDRQRQDRGHDRERDDGLPAIVLTPLYRHCETQNAALTSKPIRMTAVITLVSSSLPNSGRISDLLLNAFDPLSKS
jgi:hypothetical protein